MRSRWRASKRSTRARLYPSRAIPIPAERCPHCLLPIPECRHSSTASSRTPRPGYVAREPPVKKRTKTYDYGRSTPGFLSRFGPARIWLAPRRNQKVSDRRKALATERPTTRSALHLHFGQTCPTRIIRAGDIGSERLSLARALFEDFIGIHRCRQS